MALVWLKLISCKVPIRWGFSRLRERQERFGRYRLLVRWSPLAVSDPTLYSKLMIDRFFSGAPPNLVVLESGFGRAAQPKRHVLLR